MSIVSGSDEEEVMQVEDQLDQSGEQLDQDFDFIDEVLATHMQDIQSKEAVIDQVKRAVEKGKRKISEEQLDATMGEVRTLEENFEKVIGFAQFLMENCRKFSNQVAEQQAQNMQMEHN